MSEWKTITDLPEDWERLKDPELYSLANVWAEQKSSLQEANAVKEFNEKLLREWSIETGIIERLYTIDRGITQLLIEQGIDAALIPHGATNLPVAEVIKIINDHRDALEGLFDFVASRQPLTTSYIKQLHQMITRSQEYVEGVDQFGNPVHTKILRGEWKQWSNNPTRPDGIVHEYCPPLNVASEMDRLIELFNSHKDVSPEIEAAWLHHRFAQIHPFQDGNGRVARALATVVFLQAGWFPLVINRDQRSDYINALELADQGDLKPLVSLFGQNSKKAFARALSASEDILSAEATLPQIVESLADVYKARRVATEQIYEKVEDLASHLMNEAISVLKEVSEDLKKKFSSIPKPPVLRVNHSNSKNDYYYYVQIVSTAKDLGYWAHLSRKRVWVRLHLFDHFSGQKTQIVFSFHYFGKVNRGIMVCTGFIYFPEVKPHNLGAEEDEGESQIGEVHPICSEPFYFSYQEADQIKEKQQSFRRWMKDAISVGLAEWAQRL